MIFALDSNIILYAEGINDAERQDIANRLVMAVGIRNLVVPLQALGEMAFSIERRLKVKKEVALAMVLPWFDNLRTQETTRTVFQDAMNLTSNHQFQFWDAIILSAAKVGGASVLFSEDMQHGFFWEGVTILNPFSKTPNPIVLELLGQHSN
jgi:predicted nucleic acid-binding protein